MMITDSGLGGLSVCAGLEQALRKKQAGHGIELLYVNATPDDRIGYNSLGTQAERVELFNRFLMAAYKRFTPDEIAIACNTLSVIYDETEFAKQNLVKVSGIVDAGVKQCNENLIRFPGHDLIIFATETTTEAGTYPRSINLNTSRIVAQACPGLAHAISNDATGHDCEELLETYVHKALQQFPKYPGLVLAFLGCTHYGYQSSVFQRVIKKYGPEVKVLNPNDLMVKELIAQSESDARISGPSLRIRFISRYRIPHVEIDSMTSYLGEMAPLTLAALQAHEVEPQLFNIN